MKKKIIITAVFLFFFFSFFVFAGSDPRELEVIYPGPGAPTDVGVGIEGYVDYVFTFIFTILGAVFFSVLIYNGIKYMVSAGDVEKTGSAIKGIKGAFLGVIIFLGSGLAVNIINPDLFVLEVGEPEAIKPTKLAPGVYACNYEMDGIGGIVNRYNTGNEEQIASATEDYHEIREEEDDDQWCMYIDTSADIRMAPGHNTYFVIPHIDEDGNAEERHGAIFFDRKEGLKEARKTGGERCHIHIGNTEHHPGFEGLGPSEALPAYADSVYPIRLNVDDDQEVSFYEGYSYNSDLPSNHGFLEENDLSDFSEATIIIGNLKEEINHGDLPDFHCESTGLPKKDTCGIRSVETTEDVILVFKNDRYCHIIDSSKAHLDESVPTKRYGIIRKERGFPNAIYFDNIEIIRGRFQ